MKKWFACHILFLTSSFFGTLLLLQIHLLSFGQTQKETQDWLKQKIESYGTSSNKTTNGAAVMTTTNTIDEFNFIGNDIIIHETELIVSTAGEVFCKIIRKYNSKLATAKIASIKIEANGITIKTVGNQITVETKIVEKICSSEQANHVLSALTDSNNKQSSYFIGIDFSKEDNLSDRMQKAATRLLSFFPKQKEAF